MKKNNNKRVFKKNENSCIPRSEGSIGIVFLSRSIPPREGRTRFCGAVSDAGPAVAVEASGDEAVALTGVVGAAAVGAVGSVGGATVVPFDLLDFVIALFGAVEVLLDFFAVGS